PARHEWILHEHVLCVEMLPRREWWNGVGRHSRSEVQDQLRAGLDPLEAILSLPAGAPRPDHCPTPGEPLREPNRPEAEGIVAGGHGHPTGNRSGPGIEAVLAEALASQSRLEHLAVMQRDGPLGHPTYVPVAVLHVGRHAPRQGDLEIG